MPSPKQFSPPSGTRDFLAPELNIRRRVFEAVSRVFESYGFEALQTPAFERLELLSGKYGEEGEKLIFKILRRGDWEASGEADLALRYDMTVPLARVVGAHRDKLGMTYKRYAIGPVWRADRPGKGRFREFVQCDLDVVGSASALGDAETILAVHDALVAAGTPDFSVIVNSRPLLAGLLEVFAVPPSMAERVLVSLDKLDKVSPDQVMAELRQRGLEAEAAERLVSELTAEDAEERIRSRLRGNGPGVAGLAEVDELLALMQDQIPSARLRFAPRLVRGLSYYTGLIWEVVSPGLPGSLAGGGRYDRLIEQLGGPDLPATGGSIGLERIMTLVRHDEPYRRADAAMVIVDEALLIDCFRLANEVRRAGVRTSIYPGSNLKLNRQLKWADEEGALYTLLYGSDEQAMEKVTVRDMSSGEQVSVPLEQVAQHLKQSLGARSRV